MDLTLLTSMETQTLIAAFVLGLAFAAVLAYDTCVLAVAVRRRYMAHADRHGARRSALRGAAALKPRPWSVRRFESNG